MNMFIVNNNEYYSYIAEILIDSCCGITIAILHEKPIYYDKITKCTQDLCYGIK